MVRIVSIIQYKILISFSYKFIYATILFIEWRNGDQNNICKNTRGIVFYSTPHRGSRVAALKQATQMVLWPSIEVQELREGILKLYYDVSLKIF